MTRELNIICNACKKPIDDQTGTLWVSNPDLNNYQDAQAAWETRNTMTLPGGAEIVVVNAADLIDHPRRAQWRAHHDACHGETVTTVYEIQAHRLKTWADLVSWTAHLMEKDWLGDTDWAPLLDAATRGESGTIVPASVPNLNA
ncbi:MULTISPECIES: hypothetical protein [unclassified Kitasatospora]|uniref:hypothetical protein n=1 Tax=unclassified Kitasatospora TaxID=2633591 RepID=UPI00070B486F|nr:MULTISPECIES: hypothetical protein [unclassified Kitasatospora]KQV20546.1 hypothetical protein ASC99_21030 [Kitasatospora sp. Root107]KRB69123.1 hypothetical protein ASE03_28575 [Kitasatospora sp. Root187]